VRAPPRGMLTHGGREVGPTGIEGGVGASSECPVPSSRVEFAPEDGCGAEYAREGGEELAHRPESDDEDGIAALEPSLAPERADAGGEGLDEGRGLEVHSVGEDERIVLDAFGPDPCVFREPAGRELAAFPGRAVRPEASSAFGARHARCVVVREDAVTGAEGGDPFADGDDGTGGFVPEDGRRLRLDVPLERIGPADAARLDAQQRLARPRPRHGHLPHPDVAPAVEPRDTHGLGDPHGRSSGRSATLIAVRESASWIASSSRGSGRRWVMRGSTRIPSDVRSSYARRTAARP